MALLHRWACKEQYVELRLAEEYFCRELMQIVLLSIDVLGSQSTCLQVSCNTSSKLYIHLPRVWTSV